MGDPHGDFEPIIRAVQASPPAAVIILGDMDLDAPLETVLAPIRAETQVFWIAGNHDGDRDEWYDRLFHSELAGQDLHGRVVDIAGIRVAGLSGVFRGQVWHPDLGIKFARREDYRHAHPKERWRDGLPRRHRVSIWWEDFERMADLQADVLVCHEAPSAHRLGFEAIDELAALMGVKTIFHGHHHEDYKASIPAYDIGVYGVGRAGVTDIEGNVLSPGKSRPPRPV